VKRKPAIGQVAQFRQAGFGVLAQYRFGMVLVLEVSWLCQREHGGKRRNQWISKRYAVISAARRSVPVLRVGESRSSAGMHALSRSSVMGGSIQGASRCMIAHCLALAVLLPAIRWRAPRARLRWQPGDKHPLDALFPYANAVQEELAQALKRLQETVAPVCHP
jgi:hypothetical protein